MTLLALMTFLHIVRNRRPQRKPTLSKDCVTTPGFEPVTSEAAGEQAQLFYPLVVLNHWLVCTWPLGVSTGASCHMIAWPCFLFRFKISRLSSSGSTWLPFRFRCFRFRFKMAAFPVPVPKWPHFRFRIQDGRISGSKMADFRSRDFRSRDRK